MSVALQITEVVLTVIMKVPDIIRVFKELGNGKVKQEHENLAQVSGIKGKEDAREGEGKGKRGIEGKRVRESRGGRERGKRAR